MIDLQHIFKRFGRVSALEDVTLSIQPGQVLGLLGENGAGKSTLMSILFGLLRADGGTISIGGSEVHIRSPHDAQAMGIGMVHQHFKLVPTLTALENLALFLRDRGTSLRRRAGEWLDRLRWSVPLDRPIESLAVGQQQRIEILKALLAVQRLAPGTQSSVLILDEPTAVLTPQETSELFGAVRNLRDAGTAVVFISHKLAEVRQVCDQIAILRRGRLVHTGPVIDISSETIAEKMVGARVDIPHLQIKNQKPGSKHEDGPALVLNGLSTTQLHEVSLAIHAGEILGIAGVDGNGQSHLVQAILNTLLPPGILSGRVSIGGRDAATLSTRLRLDQIAFIAEDRQREALVLPLSVEDNLMLKDYRQRRFNTLGFLRFRAWRSHSKTLVRDFDVRTGSVSDTAGHLSGGNQQKLVLARELHTQKPIILAVNPTRGLDVGATAFVLQKLLDARTNDAAILMIHSDLDELLAVSDRIAVLYNGRLTSTRWPETTKERIGQLMLGIQVE